MRLLLLFILSIGFQLAFCQFELDQVISVEPPIIALMDIEPDESNIVFEHGISKEAGLPLDYEVVSEKHKWINFTSSVRRGSSWRKVEVQMVGNNQQRAVDVFIKVVPELRGAKGATGRASSKKFIRLTSSPKTIIRRIGGAVTGDGEQGYRLIFKSKIKKFKRLRSGALSFSLIYTLTDD